MHLRVETESHVLTRPERQTVPVVFSSPHSGNVYPPEFTARSQLDPLTLRSSEDAFVDALFAVAPDLGAPLLCAKAPRAYLDLNRAADELDPAVVEGIDRAPHNPRISSGLGVIPRVVAAGRPIYSGKLTRIEAESRITRFWHPFHRALAGLIEETRAQFGQVVVIDCHSMPHEAIESQARPGVPLPQVVLGDRFGASAARPVVERIEAAFATAGLRVVRNAPFAGAYITQAYGRPSRGVHVIQVEIDRSLYMNEAQVVPAPQFDSFRDCLSGVIAQITGDLRNEAALAAE